MPQFPFYSYPKVYIFSILPNISPIICSYLASLNSIKSHKRHMSHGFRGSNYITMIQFIVMM